MRHFSIKAAWLCAGLLAGAFPVAAMPHQVSHLDNFTQDDAVKALPWVQAAMTTPMMDMLAKANIHNPQIMLEYGLALELGRPSVSQNMAKDDREKLKRGFRAMLDLYLNKSDKFDINFDEDAMLDQPEFWSYLAKHVGRPKPLVDVRAAAEAAQQATNAMSANASDPTGADLVWLPDVDDQDQEFNLGDNDLVLPPHVVNAAISCAESAMGFARMGKIQTIAIAATKLTPGQFATVQQNAATAYRTAYAEGVMACSSPDAFMQVAGFARQHLGALGAMTDDPNARPVSLTATPVPASQATP
ncbi:hypothetical protein [Asticcacaulis sp. EMRT-3]|uniref:hypothetical protein n=1 Tax=Asticcacaulis sp. EMRT-3 TaxID=3040349 RepID=UPI0024AFAE78|nr:hypothetical protein [Asticcacaulis sp. EMRT-3]MDI7775564.1 hypothetical protein [Asticcacaulis sp. EMRT-3]